MDCITKWLKQNILFVLGFILAGSLLWPLFAAPYFSHHDDVQTIRLYEMNKCFQDGQIPCRWVPDLGGLYGYPLFNFYAPLPYYFGEIIYWISHNLILSSKVMFATAFLGSFIFMYLLARKLWGSWGGLISAVFYTYAPYHAVDFYVRGAMEELWGLMFFPAIFWAILRLKEVTRIYNALILSLLLGFLILSHNISTMLFLPLSVFFVIFLFALRRDMRFLKFSAFAFILALMMAAFYWLPMITEKNLVHVESMTGGYFSYTEHYKGLRKLFLEREWGWGASVREVPGGERDGMSFQIGWIHILGWVLTLFTVQYLWRRNRSVSLTIIFFSIIAAVSIFMINPRSLFLWNFVDPLKYLQFPWRFLMLIIFFTSLVAGSAPMRWNQRKGMIVGAILLVLVVGANFTYFRPEKFINVTDKDLLTGSFWDKQIKRSIFDFLPIFAQEPPAELSPERYRIIVGEASINSYREGTNWFNFKADIKTHTILQISKYYFPNWKVFVDGQEAVVEYRNNHLGLMTLILGPGTYYIEGRLFDTPIRSIANMLSMIGLVITFLLIPTQIPKTRRWLTYYLRGMNR